MTGNFLFEIKCFARHEILFFLATVLITLSSRSQSTLFPLRISDDKKILVDRNNKSFLVKEISAWGLMQSLSEKEEVVFLDSISKKGFNTVLTCITIKHSQITGNPPDWQGVPPFSVKWDFSTPNPIYFEHVDRFLKMALKKNIFVLAVPAYLGYRDDASQGWWDEMKSEHNDTLKMKMFGEFLGNRYKGISNLMWVAGGDNNGSGDLFPYENNLLRGIKSKDPDHLWTGHFDANLNVNWSTENKLYAEIIDIDALYVWSETVMLDKGPQYKTELAHYNKGKMIMQLDQSYEHDAPHFADNENYQWIRRKMYDGLLSGCAGTSFSPGTTDNQCYSFKNWKPLMNTTGMQQVSYCFKLFDSRAWEKLIPDQSNDIIITGRGTFGTLDYICAAKALDNSLYILYIPSGRIIYLNINKIADKPLLCHWYNPRTGEVLKIGAIADTDKFGFATPSTEDWVLVMDLEALKLPLPGIAKYK